MCPGAPRASPSLRGAGATPSVSRRGVGRNAPRTVAVQGLPSLVDLLGPGTTEFVNLDSEYFEVNVTLVGSDLNCSASAAPDVTTVPATSRVLCGVVGAHDILPRSQNFGVFVSVGLLPRLQESLDFCGRDEFLRAITSELFEPIRSRGPEVFAEPEVDVVLDCFLSLLLAALQSSVRFPAGRSML